MSCKRQRAVREAGFEPCYPHARSFHARCPLPVGEGERADRGHQRISLNNARETNAPDMTVDAHCMAAKRCASPGTCCAGPGKVAHGRRTADPADGTLCMAAEHPVWKNAAEVR